MQRVLIAISLLAVLALSAPARGIDRKLKSSKVDPISGRWDAMLKIPSGDVAFELDLQLRGSVVEGAVLNGSERQPFTAGSFDGTTLTLRFDYYDGQITANYSVGANGELAGEYARQTSSGIGHYEFHAVRRPTGSAKPVGPVATSALAGEWVLTLRDKDGKVEEVDNAVFTSGKDGRLGPEGGVRVAGSIIPVSGDSGLLARVGLGCE